MVAHGRNRKMATIAISPDPVTLGQSFTAIVTDAPNGRNFVSAQVFAGGGPGSGYWAQRKAIHGSEDVSFTPTIAGTLVVYLDDDADLSDGHLAQVYGTVV